MKYLTASVVFKKAIILALVVGVAGCKTSSKTRTKRVANNKTAQSPPPVGSSTTIGEMEASAAEARKKAEADKKAKEAAEARKKAETDKKAQEEAAAFEARKNADAIRASEVAAAEAKKAKEAADKAELVKNEKEDADRKLKAEADKKVQEAAAKKDLAEKEAADKRAQDEAARKAAEKKDNEVKNSFQGKLKIKTDEAKVLKNDDCSLSMEANDTGALVKMSFGGNMLEVDILDKAVEKKVSIVKTKPAMVIMTNVDGNPEKRLIRVMRTYFVLSDKAIVNSENLEEINKFFQDNLSKVNQDTSYEGMSASSDILIMQSDEKGIPIAFQYSFQDLVNGSKVVTDGKASYKTKNGLNVFCNSEEAAAVAASAAAAK